MNSGNFVPHDAERIPPQAIDVERTVLGTMIISADGATIAINRLSDDSFYASANQKVFVTLRDMVSGEIKIDLVTLAAELRNRGWLESVGEEPYLCELIESIATAENIPHYCRILLEKQARRKMISTAHALMERAFDDGKDITSAITETDAEFAALQQMNTELDPEEKVSSKILRAGDFLERMQSYQANGFINTAVSTGWDSLNGCYRPARGMLNIVHGIPSHGKSSVMDALAMNISSLHGWKHLYFSPENFPLEYHLQKLTELYVGKPLRKYGDVEPCTREEVEAANAFIHEHFSFIYLSESGHNLSGMMRLVKSAMKEGKYDSLIIDPWNELDYEAGKGERETDYIGKSLSSLRRFGRRNDMAIFVLVHPAKMYKKPGSKVYDVPTMYDLAGSAHWYNKADNGVCVYRDFEAETVQLHIQKIKNKPHGHIGVVTMKYLNENGRLVEVDQTEGNGDNW